MGSASLSDLLQDATRRLANAGLRSARLEAEVLVAWLLGCSRAGLVARGAAELIGEFDDLPHTAGTTGRCYAYRVR